MEESLDELGELAATAGAYVAGRIIQNREAIHPGTYIGKGKIEEVKGLLYALNANGVICDDELSPAQMNNLERELECKVMDRTLLILDIFAKRAVTSEGKIPGRACTAPLPFCTSCGTSFFSLKAWRRNRYQRSR